MTEDITTKDMDIHNGKRFLAAKKNYKVMRALIAPYVKRRKFTVISTTGQWCEATHSSEEPVCRRQRGRDK